MRNLSVYLASRFSNRPLLIKMRDEELIPRGFTVTSRWLDQKEPPQDEPSQDVNIRRFRLERAYEDLADIDNSDVVILDLTFDHTGYRTYGAIFEAGYTCAARIPLILIGENGSVFWELPFVTQVSTWNEAIQLLERWASTFVPKALTARDGELPVLAKTGV